METVSDPCFLALDFALHRNAATFQIINWAPTSVILVLCIVSCISQGSIFASDPSRSKRSRKQRFVDFFSHSDLIFFNFRRNVQNNDTNECSKSSNLSQDHFKTSCRQKTLIQILLIPKVGSNQMEPIKSI